MDNTNDDRTLCDGCLFVTTTTSVNADTTNVVVVEDDNVDVVDEEKYNAADRIVLPQFDKHTTTINFVIRLSRSIILQ
jgi:hypothetical protein